MVFEIVSLLALIFGLLVKFVGMPQQFLRNRARRSTEGVSGWFYLLGILSYASASAQAWLAHALVLALTGGVPMGLSRVQAGISWSEGSPAGLAGSSP